MNRSRITIGFLGAACVLLAAPARAQVSPGGTSSARPVVGTAPTPEKPEAPPALPGSRAEATAVAPASRPAADMQPTEALFDAVNRGDLAAAKDALNRGADTNGLNVLGLTPLDLAIDLGRNEITFILLSMRGAEPSGQSPAVPVAAAQPGSRAGARRHQAADSEPRASARARQARLSPTQQRGGVAQAPTRFAGDGGTPNPQAGFLGFGSAR